MARVAAAVGALQAAVQAVSTPARAASSEAYLKHVVRARGAANPAVAGVFRDEFAPTVAPLSRDEHLAAAAALFASDYIEDKAMGSMIWERCAKEVARRGTEADAGALLSVVEREFDNAHIHEWATCDCVCSRVLFPLTVAHAAAAVPRIVAYSHAPSIWRQRAAAVTWVRHGRSGLHTDACMEVAATLVHSSERFVQLGNGWMLREVWRAHPDRVKSFIVGHITAFSREGLRYAVEKMPKEEAAQLLALQLEEKQKRKSSGGDAPPPAKRARRARG